MKDIMKEKTVDLWKSTSDWERIFDTLPDFIAILDSDYRILRANRAMTQQLGVTPEKAAGLVCYECVHGTSSPPNFCPQAQMLLDGKEHMVEIHEPRLGGDCIVSASPLTNENGELIGSIHVARTITELKKGEEAFKKTNEELEQRVQDRTKEVSSERQRLYNVLETLPAYVLLLDKDYHVPFANRFFRERFGESKGRPCYEFLFNRSSPCENCETYTVQKTNKPHHWEWTGPDGRNYDIYDFPFVEDDSSNFILEMGIDITDRKKAEEQLRTASLYSRSLLEASLDPLITINAEGKITDVNKATEESTGCSREKLIGSDFSHYFTEPEKARAGYQRVLAESFIRDYPLTIRHTNGKTMDVLYNATVYKNEAGQVQGIFAAARDVTERKRAEEAVQKRDEIISKLSTPREASAKAL